MFIFSFLFKNKNILNLFDLFFILLPFLDITFSINCLLYFGSNHLVYACKNHFWFLGYGFQNEANLFQFKQSLKSSLLWFQVKLPLDLKLKLESKGQRIGFKLGFNASYISLEKRKLTSWQLFFSILIINLQIIYFCKTIISSRFK